MTFLIAVAFLCGTQMAVGVVCDNRVIFFHLVLLIDRGIVISKMEGQKQITETHQSSWKGSIHLFTDLYEVLWANNWLCKSLLFFERTNVLAGHCFSWKTV